MNTVIREDAGVRTSFCPVIYFLFLHDMRGSNGNGGIAFSNVERLVSYGTWMGISVWGFWCA